MYACVEVVFQNAENKLIKTQVLDLYRYGVNNCTEIKIPTDAKSTSIGVSFIDLEVNSSIKVNFYSTENKLISSSHLELFEFRSNWEKFEIPNNCMTMIVCFTAEYKLCENCV